MTKNGKLLPEAAEGHVRSDYSEAMGSIIGEINSPDTEERQTAADKIAAAVNGDLEKVGMRLSNLEITELWSRSKPSGGKGAN